MKSLFSTIKRIKEGGTIPAGQMTGYQAMDFIWSIPFYAR
jgi:hypothetical protein